MTVSGERSTSQGMRGFVRQIAGRRQMTGREPPGIG